MAADKAEKSCKVPDRCSTPDGSPESSGVVPASPLPPKIYPARPEAPEDNRL
jgi:hypothetical protein